MRRALETRLRKLEADHGGAAQTHVLFVKAPDDGSQQVAAMIASGQAHDRDLFVTIRTFYEPDMRAMQ